VVLPVTGPIVEVLQNTPIVFERHEKYRQVKPYDRILPYKYRKGLVTRKDPGAIDRGPSAVAGPYLPSYNAAVSKAYSKLAEKARSNSLWLVNVAERQQAVNMIETRAKQLIKVIKELKRFNFAGVAAVLADPTVTNRTKLNKRKTKLETVPLSDIGQLRRDLDLWAKKSTEETKKLRRRKRLPPDDQSSWWKESKRIDRNMANQFLEVHFGWGPLFEDIGNAMELLQQDFSPKRIKARAKGDKFTFVTTNVATYKTTYQTLVQLQTDVQITNPNLHLFTGLGFANLPATLWELLPWSFIVDHYVNIGQCLSAWDSFLGQSLTNSSTVQFDLTQCIDTWPGGKVATTEFVQMERRLGLSGPSLYIKPFNGFSVVRAATYISLLIQQLKS